jgi:superfamily II DNA or RNA helicase
MTALRPYQEDVIKRFYESVAAGHKRIIKVMPTGSGKTITACEIIRTAVASYQFVVVLAHRREIISQTSAKLNNYGINHGIIQAGFDPRPMERVQLASVQTLWSRAMRNDVMDLPPAHLVVVDEAHHSTAETYRQIIARYPEAVLLGMTATPCRGDGRGLGGIFDTLIEGPQVPQLIELGFLVKTRVYAPAVPNLNGIRVQAGDYVESQLAERMDRPELTGDIVVHWHKLAERRRTVCFATGVQHSIHLRDEFVRSGVRAEHIDGGTPKPERDAALMRLASGEIELITNCMVLTEGWDMPEVGCCILARPTRKMGLHRQMLGRVLRPADGKADAIILDHSGAVYRHGFAEDPVEWTLSPDRYAGSEKHAARCETDSPSRLVECSQCGVLRTAGEPCSNCGFLPQRPPRAIFVGDGDLSLVDNNRRAGQIIYHPVERARWHGMLTYIAQERNYKSGWVAHQYKRKFGTFPVWGARPEAIAPTPECRSWVRSRMIAYAKGSAA